MDKKIEGKIIIIFVCGILILAYIIIRKLIERKISGLEDGWTSLDLKRISLAYYKFYVSFGGIAGLVILITITVNFISNY